MTGRRGKARPKEYPRPELKADGNPTAVFQWNYGWGVWEQLDPGTEPSKDHLVAYPAKLVNALIKQRDDALSETYKLRLILNKIETAGD